MPHIVKVCSPINPSEASGINTEEGEGGHTGIPLPPGKILSTQKKLAQLSMVYDSLHDKITACSNNY